MRIFRVVALAALLAAVSAPVAAPAQTPSVNLMPELPTKTPEEKEADAVREKAYRESLRKIPDAKTSSDPWGNVRAPEPAKAAPKPKTKTGSTAN